MKHRGKGILSGLGALVTAVVIWIPCLHFLFTKPVWDFHSKDGVSPKARALSARHLHLWTDLKLRE